MSQRDSFWASWQERLSALRNIPPVLKIVWDSGPAVVALGLVFRLIASLLPLALLGITKLIIDAIVHSLTSHQPVQPKFWWLVVAEFGVAVIASVITRGIDYTDALLADKYMRHVSIQVMKHAAEPGPDRLRRSGLLRPVGACASAGDGPAGHDSVDRATGAAGHHHGIAVGLDHVFLAVAAAAADCWGGTGISWRESFCVPGYAKNFRQTPIRRQLDYLRVLGGSKEAAKELKLFGLSEFLTERFTTALQRRSMRRTSRLRAARLVAGCFAFASRHRRGTTRAYAYVIWRTMSGALTIGITYVSGRRDPAGEHEHSADFFNPVEHSRPGSVPHRPAGLLRDEADDPLEAECACRRRGQSDRIRVSQCVVSLSWHFERLILNRLDFHLRPGERVALIGENGQGKTTIVKLITRLYDPTEGADPAGWR